MKLNYLLNASAKGKSYAKNEIFFFSMESALE
jgi:hypothetical protein